MKERKKETKEIKAKRKRGVAVKKRKLKKTE